MGRFCIIGKPCGKTCIPLKKNCYKAPSNSLPQCKEGKSYRCGRTCISTKKTCQLSSCAIAQ